MNIGYACINMTMGKKVTTNRTMVKKTFNENRMDALTEELSQRSLTLVLRN